MYANSVKCKRLMCVDMSTVFLFFPSQNQSDDSRVALPSLCHMVSPQIEVEEEVLGFVECLAPLVEPILSVAFRQLDNLRTDVLQIFFSFFLAEDVEDIGEYMEEDVVIATELHGFIR